MIHVEDPMTVVLGGMVNWLESLDYNTGAWTKKGAASL